MSGNHLLHNHEEDNYVISGSTVKRVGKFQYFLQWCYGVSEPTILRVNDWMLRHTLTRNMLARSKANKVLPKCLVLSTDAVCRFIDYIYTIEGPKGARMGIGDCVCQTALGRMREPRRKDMVLLYTADLYNNIVKTYDPIDSAEEAKRLIREFHRVGLIHTVFYCFGSGQWTFVMCNCDDEVCVPLRGHLAGKPMMLPGPEIVTLDSAKCIGVSKCGNCLKRCILQACSVSGEKSGVDEAKCLGCGLCTSTCPGGARQLTVRKEYKYEDLMSRKIVLDKEKHVVHA